VNGAVYWVGWFRRELLVCDHRSTSVDINPLCDVYESTAMPHRTSKFSKTNPFYCLSYRRLTLATVDHRAAAGNGYHVYTIVGSNPRILQKTWSEPEFWSQFLFPANVY